MDCFWTKDETVAIASQVRLLPQNVPKAVVKDEGEAEGAKLKASRQRVSAIGSDCARYLAVSNA